MNGRLHAAFSTSLLAVLLVAPLSSSRAASIAQPPDPRAMAEIQIGLCGAPDAIVQALALRPRGAPQEVWLFDDPALQLFARGLRLRLRVADDRAEITLKVADQDCSRPLPAKAGTSEGKCEYDLHGTEITGALSLSWSLAADTSRGIIDGRIAPADALAPAQTLYLRDVARLWPLPPEVRALGPQKVIRYRAKSKPYDVDDAVLPDGRHFIEISRKVRVADAGRLRRVLEEDLAKAGVEACADQSGQAVEKLRALLR